MMRGFFVKEGHAGHEFHGDVQFQRFFPYAALTQDVGEDVFAGQAQGDQDLGQLEALLVPALADMEIVVHDVLLVMGIPRAGDPLPELTEHQAGALVDFHARDRAVVRRVGV